PGDGIACLAALIGDALVGLHGHRVGAAPVALEELVTSTTPVCEGHDAVWFGAGVAVRTPHRDRSGAVLAAAVHRAGHGRDRPKDVAAGAAHRERHHAAVAEARRKDAR